MCPWICNLSVDMCVCVEKGEGGGALADTCSLARSVRLPPPLPPPALVHAAPVASVGILLLQDFEEYNFCRLVRVGQGATPEVFYRPLWQ